MSLWNENYRIMKEIKDIAISYVMFVENGGHSGYYPDALQNKAIALLTKIKVNRDMLIDAIPTESQECDTAIDILNGVYKENRFNDVIARLYGGGNYERV